MDIRVVEMHYLRLCNRYFQTIFSQDADAIQSYPSNVLTNEYYRVNKTSH